MMFILFFIGYLVILMAVGYGVNSLMSPLFGRAWRLFVAPGVIIHELSHALACVLTGADIHEINFWKASGGHVIHTAPRIHLLGPVLISFAPMIVMTGGLFLLAPLLNDSLGNLAWTRAFPQTLSVGLSGYLASLFEALRSFDWTTLKPWLLLYVMLNVAVTIAPSKQDLKNTVWALAAVVILVALAARTVRIVIPFDLVWPPVATSLILLGLVVVFAMVVWLSRSLTKK